jgi:lipopolysaccharide/colanic/teichoic acid biosynthesis glycosyltransferase
MPVSPPSRCGSADEPEPNDDRSYPNEGPCDIEPKLPSTNGPLDELAHVDRARATKRATFRTGSDLAIDPIFVARGPNPLASLDAAELVSQWATTSRVRRATDLALDALFAPVTLPALAGASIALALEGKVGNIRFNSARIGKDHEIFLMHKLRTLLGGDQSDSSEGAEDPRATRVGRLVRKYIVDEMLVLPTNVVKGQMQLVAHRPLVEADMQLMAENLRPEDNRIWRAVYGAEPPGFLSAFGNLSPFLDAKSDEYFRARAVLDVWQAMNAGPRLSKRIIEDTIRIGLGKIDDPSQLVGYKQTHGARSLVLAA